MFAEREEANMAAAARAEGEAAAAKQRRFIEKPSNWDSSSRSEQDSKKMLCIVALRVEVAG